MIPTSVGYIGGSQPPWVFPVHVGGKSGGIDVGGRFRSAPSFGQLLLLRALVTCSLSASLSVMEVQSSDHCSLVGEWVV